MNGTTVTSPKLDATLPGSVNPIGRWLGQCLTLAEMELRKLRHDPTELLTRAIQPALWLLVFGEVFTRIHAIPTGDLRYMDFLAPGVLAQSVLFIAIFYGIAVIWERDLGLVHKLLVSPASRAALSSIPCMHLAMVSKTINAGGSPMSFALRATTSPNACI